MDLYHYTSVPLLHSILNEGISRGHFLRSDDHMLYGHCWYTTSPLPYGHGLPDGTEQLTESEKEFAYRAAGENVLASAKSLHNKHLVRIRVNRSWLKEQDEFYKFTKLLQLYGESSLYGKILGVMGWVKPDSLSDKELKRWIKSPKLKHDTWYVHRGVLPVEQIISVDFMATKDSYIPYDFELHGRPELERNGIFSISASELAELNNIGTGISFLNGSVGVICPHPDHTPAVVFRKRNSAVVIRIQDGKVVGSDGYLLSADDILEGLSDWTRSHSDSLMANWKLSEKSWYRYNS